MNAPDTAILATALAIALGLVRLMSELIKMGWSRVSGRNGDDDIKGLRCPVNAGDGIKALHDIGYEQLDVMRDLGKSLDALTYEIRAQGLEQGHVQKSVEALHRRVDDVTVLCKTKS